MTHPTVTQALSPCPFCGGEAKVVAPLGWGNVRSGECGNRNCSATGPWARNEAEAIAAWNTRATEASTAARIAALEAEKARLRSTVDGWRVQHEWLRESLEVARGHIGELEATLTRAATALPVLEKMLAVAGLDAGLAVAQELGADMRAAIAKAGQS